MKNKISRGELQTKSKSIKNLIEGIVEDTIKIPDNALVFVDYDDILEIFTRKRLELIKIINKVKPKSLKQLANLTDRKKQAVNRDIKILQNHEILKLNKKGRTVIPKINKKLIFLPLTFETSISNIEKTIEADQKAIKKEKPILAEIYVDRENINQKLMS